MNHLHTYKYFINEKKRQVIAVSTYAGKTVKGIATCSDADEFDIEKGKLLAAARCNFKIAKKRRDRAKQKCMEVKEKLEQAEEEYYQAENYRRDSAIAFWDALINLNNLLEDLKQ